MRNKKWGNESVLNPRRVTPSVSSASKVFSTSKKDFTPEQTTT
jgi:hypothetical protein